MPDSGNEKNSNTIDDSPSTATPKYNKARRRLLATLGTGGAIAVAKTLPESWTKPLIDSMMLPAHGVVSTTTTAITNNADFITARDLWFSDEALATSTYGLIK